MGSKKWAQQIHKNETIIAAPFAVAGHSAHVIRSEMFVIFGYNPLFGFMHHVQIYNFGKETKKEVGKNKKNAFRNRRMDGGQHKRSCLRKV